MATNQSINKAYTASIDIKFFYDDTEGKSHVEQIDPKHLTYFYIMSNYERNVIPVIIMSMTVQDDIYAALIKYKNNGKFRLDITKQNVLSNSRLMQRSFTDFFSYILSSVNPNDHAAINNPGDGSYRRITVGLISHYMVNINRVTFNGIYKDIDSNTLIRMALNGIQCICEYIPYNHIYDTVIVPPITTRFMMLKFIQSINPFFDTEFKYFMDFNGIGYLTSESGISTGDDTGINNIMINIVELDDPRIMEAGVVENDSSYIINIPTTQYRLSEDQVKEKVLNNIVGVDLDYGVGMDFELDDDDMDNMNGITKQTFIRTNSANIIKNRIESSKIAVTIYKADIDGSIFTPNRIITINHCDENYKKYNGQYKLVDKKEVFRNSTIEDQLNISIMVTLKPIGNVSVVGNASNNRRFVGTNRNRDPEIGKNTIINRSSTKINSMDVRTYE